jgi:cation:H+ antiporter
MVLFVPLDIVSPGPLLAGVSLNHAVTGIMTILVTSVAVMGQLYRVERRKWLIEPDALMVIALIIGTLALLYALR